MRKLYHCAGARSMRSVWLLHELGLEFELVTLGFSMAALRTPEYLAISPLGRVPCLVDGDVTNCRPENLLLITRAEHLRLTKLGFKWYPESLKPAVVAIARLEAKTFSRKREFQKNEEKICRK